MPNLPRLWTGARMDRPVNGQPVLLDGVVYDPSDPFFGGQEGSRGPSLTFTYEVTEDDGATTRPGQYVMVSMTPLQAAVLRDAITEKLDRHARNEIQGERVAQIVGTGPVTEASRAAAEVQARPVPTVDPELERLLAEEEEIERSMRYDSEPEAPALPPIRTSPIFDAAGAWIGCDCPACVTVREASRFQQPEPTTGPEARPADPTLAEVRSALRNSDVLQSSPPIRPRRERYYRDPERTIPVQVRPLP